ncbi:hypothetical protein JW935_21460 [candidate division KSB1 bacterium]|nr:hypothetical protein [candidate division KSB1 bacterium]
MFRGGFPEPAIEILVSTKQYVRGLAFCEDGLKYNTSGFLYKWAGQLSLATGTEQKGIGYLETAAQLLPRDTQVLYNLIRAYHNTHQLTKGDALMPRLRQLAPNTPEIKELENFRKQSQRH